MGVGGTAGICCEDPAPIMKSGAPDCLGKRGLVVKPKAPRRARGRACSGVLEVAF